MSLPNIATREEWLAARRELLAEEKMLTRAHDRLATRRRELPMVRVTKDYAFEGPEGTASLRDLFAGRSQLIVGHFMFDPRWEEGCQSCSAGADEISAGHHKHLNERDTTFVFVARAPYPKLEAFRARRGWPTPFFSSHGSDFNFDFGVSLDESVAPPVYNFSPLTGLDGERPIEMPGKSCFLRVGDDVFHTYSHFARGLETIGGSYYLLDLTALGRQEPWEEPKGRAAALTDGFGAAR